MATYKAVMRPALEYASSVWSPIASSTSINKLQVMQNAAVGTSLHYLLVEARINSRISSFFGSFSSLQFMLVFSISSVWRSMLKFFSDIFNFLL